MVLKVIALCLFWAATALSRNFNNPVIEADVPDPGVMKVNGAYYVVTTGGDNQGNKFPIHVSNDLQNWVQMGYALVANNKPRWSYPDREYWAPEVHQFGDNDFRLYFTARSNRDEALSVGVARASSPLGPYTATDDPLVSDPNMGAIDATILRTGSDVYLVWKDDGNAVGRPTPIWAQRMNGDGLSIASNERTQILINTLPWEGNLVEGVWHVERNGMHYLFYSGNGYCGDAYAVGVARSQNPLGPYEKRGDPILRSNDAFKGPGHCSVVPDTNGVDTVMVYHAWHAGRICNGNPRVLLVGSVGWGNDGWPYMA